MRAGQARPDSLPLEKRGGVAPVWADLARSLRRQGLSYRAIGEQLQVHPRRVYKTLNRERVRATDTASDHRNRAKLTAKRRERLLQLAPDCSRCGRKLAKPPKSDPPLCGKCIKHRPYPEPEWYQEALSLRKEEGLTYTAIGKRLGRHPATISRVLHTITGDLVPDVPLPQWWLVVLELRWLGYSHREIAQKVEKWPSDIRRVLRRLREKEYEIPDAETVKFIRAGRTIGAK